MSHGFGVRKRRAAAAAIVGLVATSGPAWSAESAPLTDQAQILRRFPHVTGVVGHGVKLRLKSGDWLDITDNPFGERAPILCWFSSSLHVAGVCLLGRGVTVTTLIDLNTGRRLAAPGVPRLMPQAGWLAVGPDEARGVGADSVTLVQVEADDLIDEGGALFDGDYGPGSWVDGDCYRLSAKAGTGGAWLEHTPAGWRQTVAAESTVCQGRHGR